MREIPSSSTLILLWAAPVAEGKYAASPYGLPVRAAALFVLPGLLEEAVCKPF